MITVYFVEIDGQQTMLKGETFRAILSAHLKANLQDPARWLQDTRNRYVFWRMCDAQAPKVNIYYNKRGERVFPPQLL